MILYSFYKNIVLTIVLAWWTMDCGFSGQSLYESYVYSGYNFFLGMPILLLGIFDQVWAFPLLSSSFAPSFFTLCCSLHDFF